MRIQQMPKWSLLGVISGVGVAITTVAISAFLIMSPKVEVYADEVTKPTISISESGGISVIQTASGAYRTLPTVYASLWSNSSEGGGRLDWWEYGWHGGIVEAGACQFDDYYEDLGQTSIGLSGQSTNINKPTDPGTYTICIRLANTAGGVAITAKTYVIDTAPTGEITSPVSGTYFKSPNGIEVSGVFDDINIGDIITVSVAVASGGPWDVTLCDVDMSAGTFACPALSGYDEDMGTMMRRAYVRIHDGVRYNIYSVDTPLDQTVPVAPTITSVGGDTAALPANTDVSVTITDGADAHSGADYSTYTLSGATTSGETKYTGAFSISAEGETIITAYTYDKVGNKSVAATKTVYIDKTAHVITVSPNGGSFNVAQAPTVSIDGDFVAGKTVLRYAWNDNTDISRETCTGGTALLANNLAISILGQAWGTNVLYVCVIDVAGNYSYSETTFLLNPPGYKPSLSDPATGIVLWLEGMGFSGDMRLRITQITKALTDGVLAYDIKICDVADVDCASPITNFPDGLTIRIPLGGLVDTHEDFRLYYIDPVDGPTLHPSTVVGGELIFETDHLSGWEIAAKSKSGGAPNTGSGLVAPRDYAVACATGALLAIMGALGVIAMFLFKKSRQ